MKRQTILVGTLSLPSGLALCPTGLCVNSKLDKADKDTLLTFRDAWHKHQVLLVSKCRLNLNTAVGSFIIRYMFGSDKTLQWLTDQWDAVAINEGYGKSAYSMDVLLLHTREFIKEIWEEEQRRTQEIAEAVARQAEQQRLLENAKRGIYQHPDIVD